ncbi:hypothetical protein ACFO26_06000 [Lactococcus nasutitermitis]|uniref:Uncharacterized protein n=1 Tax=Lactococcus nasutitermitis TaxID=1652957 RepID=A0ABV9JCI4_9LACT|nr:hypothetical protein [Lactococcus nasutitermitis]
MRLVQGVHINGTDKHKRLWRVPDELDHIKIKKNDEAVVQTERGLGRIRITNVISTTNNIFYWHDDKEGRSGKIEVTQDVVLVYDR